MTSVVRFRKEHHQAKPCVIWVELFQGAMMADISAVSERTQQEIMRNEVDERRG